MDTDTNITYDYEDTEGEISDSYPFKVSLWEREVYMMNLVDPRNDISTYDNFAVDDEELKSVKKELADKKDMLDADFNAIEEEVRNPNDPSRYC